MAGSDCVTTSQFHCRDSSLDGPQELVNVIWSIADLLRGDFKRSEYGRFILPLVVFRRLDCLLANTKSDVLAENRSIVGWEANA